MNCCRSVSSAVDPVGNSCLNEEQVENNSEIKLALRNKLFEELRILRFQVALYNRSLDIVSAMRDCESDADESDVIRRALGFYNQLDSDRSELLDKITNVFTCYSHLADTVLSLVEHKDLEEGAKIEMHSMCFPKQFFQIYQVFEETAKDLAASLKVHVQRHGRTSLTYSNALELEDVKVIAKENIKIAKNMAIAALVQMKMARIFQKCISEREANSHAIFSWDSLDSIPMLEFGTREFMNENPSSVKNRFFQKALSLGDAMQFVSAQKTSQVLKDHIKQCKKLSNIGSLICKRAENFLKKATEVHEQAREKALQFPSEYGRALLETS